MSAYVVGLLTANHWDWYREYIEKTRPLIARHGGKYLAQGLGVVMLEGDTELPSAVVVLEFPSPEHAQAWHNDPEYQPMIHLRESGCVTQLILANRSGS